MSIFLAMVTRDRRAIAFLVSVLLALGAIHIWAEFSNMTNLSAEPALLRKLRLGSVGVNLGPAMVMNWMIFYYMGRPVSEGSEERIILVAAGMVALMNFVGRLVDAVADPLVGYFSDRWQTR